MARKPRVHFPGAFYHVIARGNGQQDIFYDDKDYQLYLRFLKGYKGRLHFLLYAYVLMPNHLHLLIEVSENPLSKLMQSLQFRYTRNFNIKYKKSGHLFQGRYKAILCEKDSYFLELSAYIHLNPVRAGLVSDPSRYQWSSYRSYMSEGKDSLVDMDFLLAQLSRKKSSARRAYHNFVKSHLDWGHREDFYELKDQRFLGKDEFVEDIHRNLKEKYPRVYNISMEAIVSQVSLILHIDSDLFYSQTRNREGALGRVIAGYLGRKLGGYENKKVAEHFNRDPVVISKGIKRLEERLKRDKIHAKKIETLEQSLISDRKEKYLISYA
jgi:REP element-mobilizing transposase RayT